MGVKRYEKKKVVWTGALLILSGAPKPYVPTDNEEIYGTGINHTYKSGMGVSYWGWFVQKIVFTPGGIVESYAGANDIAYHTGTYSIIDKWTDSDGNTCYKVITVWGDKTYGQTTLYELHRISKTESTWEYITSLNDFPAAMDTEHREYHIYYRPEE